MNLTNLNLMIYHADLQPARGIISRAFFCEKTKKASTESGESSADKKSSAGQMFLFHHHTRVRIPVRSLVTRRNGELSNESLRSSMRPGDVSELRRVCQEPFLTSYAKHKMK